MADELPKLFSDDEFNVQRQLLERRELADRRIEERRVSPVQKLRFTDRVPESTVEQKFPHIAKKLTLAWRSEACALFLGNLIINDRPDRQGFPYDVLEDLLMLNELNSTLINPAPKLANEGHDTRARRHYLGHKNIQHTVRYPKLAPDRFHDFWRG
jgi:hypothetical protein